MVNSMLDMMLGHWWRPLLDYYFAHFTWISVPLVAWLAVLVVSHLAVKDAEKSMRAALDGMPDAKKANGKTLTRRLEPVIREAASRHRWMPAGPGGIWMRRCDPDDLVEHMTHLPNYLLRFRDQHFGLSPKQRGRGAKPRRSPAR